MLIVSLGQIAVTLAYQQRIRVTCRELGPSAPEMTKFEVRQFVKYEEHKSSLDGRVDVLLTKSPPNA